jgi:hypothetical protein
VPEVHLVMSLINKGDFLMHGVVLQSRVFPPRPPMFHVKHLGIIYLTYSHAGTEYLCYGDTGENGANGGRP